MEITLRFKKAKETKGTWQFQEVTDRPRPVVGTLYMTKDVLKDLGWPQMLNVVITGLNHQPTASMESQS